jgi:lysophospholipase L1-like esterase
VLTTAPPPVIPRRRRVLYQAVTALTISLLLISVLLAGDIYLHHRVQGLAGLNVWGYRGPTLGPKKSGETRVVAVGGSTVFGYGVAWMDAWPYLLERQVNEGRPSDAAATVINLGIPAESAGTFVATLDDYQYLRYDVVLLYEGYNDLGVPPQKNMTNPAVPQYLAWRHRSPIFRWTGYFPIFPLVLNEKAMSLMHGGDLNAAYDSNQVVFRPSLATRLTAGTMKAAADIGVALENKLGRLTPEASPRRAYDSSCEVWSSYCGAMEAAVNRARQRHARVIVITQPYISDRHIEQQRALAAALRRGFADDPNVRYVNLGSLVDLHDPRLEYDGMHLTKAGNERVAAAIAPVLLEMMK